MVSKEELEELDEVAEQGETKPIVPSQHLSVYQASTKLSGVTPLSVNTLLGPANAYNQYGPGRYR